MNKYENKYFSILGDSISTLEGYSVPEYAAYYDCEHKLRADVLCTADTWWGKVIEHFGGKLLVNNSFSGSTVTRRPGCEIESYACSRERTAGLHCGEIKPDVIMVFMGMNDWGCGALPTPGEDTFAGDISVFSTAYENMLQKLQQNYPQAEICCFTLPVAARAEGKEFPFLFGGVHMEKYCGIICALADKYGCRKVDLYSYDVPYSTLDGFHPNAQGMKTLADAVITKIR